MKWPENVRCQTDIHCRKPNLQLVRQDRSAVQKVFGYLIRLHAVCSTASIIVSI